MQLQRENDASASAMDVADYVATMARELAIVRSSRRAQLVIRGAT